MKTEYQLFVCDISGEHAPICVFISDTPFPNFVIGQRFDDHGWQRLDGRVLASEEAPIRFTIHSIKQVIKVENGKNIMQTGLNLEQSKGNRSPAFSTNVTLSWQQALEIHKNLLNT